MRRRYAVATMVTLGLMAGPVLPALAAPATAAPPPAGAAMSPVTGTATSPDGMRVPVRTYVDADQPGRVSLLRHAPAPLARVTAAPKAPVAADSGGGLLGGLGLREVTYIVVAVGVLGALLVLAGLIGIRRARAHPRGQETDDADDFDDGGYDRDPYGYGPADEPGGYGRPAGGAYRAEDGHPPGGRYGGAPGAAPAPGVYGTGGRRGGGGRDGGSSARDSGTVYGGRGRHGADQDRGFPDPEPSGGHRRRFAEDPEPSGGYERGTGGRVYGRQPDPYDGRHDPYEGRSGYDDDGGRDRYDRGR